MIEEKRLTRVIHDNFEDNGEFVIEPLEGIDIRALVCDWTIRAKPWEQHITVSAVFSTRTSSALPSKTRVSSALTLEFDLADVIKEPHIIKAALSARGHEMMRAEAHRYSLMQQVVTELRSS